MDRSLNAGESKVSMRGLLIVAGLLALPGTALAQQTDYSAGKTPQQLFSGDCAACHSSPKGLAKNQDQRGLTSFLREHYTSRSEAAGALAAYLMGNPGTAAPVRNPGAPDPQGRNARTTPASAPAARPAAPAGEDPFRRVFRSVTEPEPDGSIAAPEAGEGPAPGAKPKPGAKPRTAAQPPETPARAKENGKGKKREPSEAAKDTKPSEESAKEVSAAVEATKAEAAKAEAVKAEAARAKVRAYATSGEEARPKGEPAASEPPAAAAPPAGERPASTPPG